jgi:hypothetical protein
VSVHQGNGVMIRGHPNHEQNSKPSDHFRFTLSEAQLQRELHTKQPPPNPPRPRTSKRKDGWGSESLEKSCELKPQILNIPGFIVFFEPFSLEYKTKWGSESKEPIDRGHGTLALDLPLFDDYFGCLQFKYGRESSNQD